MSMSYYYAYSLFHFIFGPGIIHPKLLFTVQELICSKLTLSSLCRPFFYLNESEHTVSKMSRGASGHTSIFSLYLLIRLYIIIVNSFPLSLPVYFVPYVHLILVPPLFLNPPFSVSFSVFMEEIIFNMPCTFLQHFPPSTLSFKWQCFLPPLSAGCLVVVELISQ